MRGGNPRCGAMLAATELPPRCLPPSVALALQHVAARCALGHGNLRPATMGMDHCAPRFVDGCARFEHLRPDDVFLDLRHGIFHNLLHTKRDWYIDCSTCRFEMRRWDVSWSLSTRSSTTCGTENVPLCSALPNRMTTICSTKRAPRSSHPPTVFPTYHLERTRFARGVRCKREWCRVVKVGKHTW